jgi:hypothetical protein
MECGGMTYPWGEIEPPTGGEVYTDLLDDVKSVTKHNAMDGVVLSYIFSLM